MMQTALLDKLLVRRLAGPGAPVLFVHGATFPSALAAGYRFLDRSWMEDVQAEGHDAWAFDFLGYGGSQRYPGMDGPPGGTPLGRAEEAADQLGLVVDHITQATGHRSVSLVAHSWGSMPAGLYATRHPERVARLCLFGPIAERRLKMPEANAAGAWRLVTLAEQLARFIEDVPPGHAPMLIEPQLEQWGLAYLASDPAAATRMPAAVKVPAGPIADIYAAWSGRLPWRPEELRAPLLVVRGDWDSVTSRADADWFLSRATHLSRHEAHIARGTHLMHLEHSREGLFAALRRFLGET